MVAWPPPTTVKQLRGFLGLTGYYRRFVAHYAVIAAPLTDLLKKDAFVWSTAAEESFNALKKAMTSAPVLRLPDFTIPFVIETDASDYGIGAVLLQDGHPLAFFSKKLGPRRRASSTYLKELYAIVEAIQKWRQYLIGREFIIRSDQRSLKELLSQVIQTPDQQFYIRKLMGYKFKIEYKSGASNKVADALSGRDDTIAVPADLMTLFHRPEPVLLDTLRSKNHELPDLVALHAAVSDGSAPKHITVADGLLHYKRRLYLSRQSALCAPLLQEFHEAFTAGHPGEKRTFDRLASTFFWLGMRRDVRKFVAACFTCQSTKYIAQKPAGLLQPLPIPERVWAAASMDFIVGLPPSRGYSAIMVVVDRLSKYAHFGALKAGFDAPRVANLFIDTVVKHHGFPEKLLSDRDPIFMSAFWTELISLSGTKLQFTTAYHPQTDGQSEVTNRALEQYLRAFTFDCPARWSLLLPWAELAMNCSFNTSIGMPPFKALYGRDPPNVFATQKVPARTPEVADLLAEREETLRTLKARLSRAQSQMADIANRHRRDVEFKVGDDVLLRLQPYRQHSVGRPIAAKLGRRFYGPFRILERIGKVAYRLQLPAESRIHNVFHVSLLRPFVPPLSESPPGVLPATFNGNRPIDVPIRATQTRTVLVLGIPQEQWCVYWASSPDSNPSWEPVDVLLQHFPTLRLEDMANSNGGGVDRDSMVHSESPTTDPQVVTAPAPPEAQARPNSAIQPARISRPVRAKKKPARLCA